MPPTTQLFVTGRSYISSIEHNLNSSVKTNLNTQVDNSSFWKETGKLYNVFIGPNRNARTIMAFISPRHFPFRKSLGEEWPPNIVCLLLQTSSGHFCLQGWSWTRMCRERWDTSDSIWYSGNTSFLENDIFGNWDNACWVKVSAGVTYLKSSL